MIVYRFERNGIGPYRGGGITIRNAFAAQYKFPNKHVIKRANRIIVEDDLSKWFEAHKRRDMIYGCASKEALRVYFAYRFKYLFASGYRIKKYEVPDNEVINIGSQCAFPVKYHKFKTVRVLDKRLHKLYSERK